MTVLIRNVFCFLPRSEALRGFSGAPKSEKKDIFISGDKISAIGSFPNKTADKIIDGQGAYCAPGFIDPYNVSDHYLALFSPYGFEPFVASGITTVVAGTDGVSLAPFHADAPLLSRWGDTRGVNFNWHTMKEFLAAVGKKKLPVNFATAVGLVSASEEFSKFSERRELKKDESLYRILSYALSCGGAGVSADLAHEGVMFLASAFARRLGERMAQAGKTLSVRLDEQRDAGAQFQTAAKFGQVCGCRLLVSYFSCGASIAARADVVSAFEKYCGENKNIFLDLGLPMVGLYEARRFLPDWVFQKGNVEEQLSDDWTARRIAAEMKLPTATLVVASSPGHEQYVGHTLAEVMERLQAKTEKETLLHLLRATSLRASFLVMRPAGEDSELAGHPQLLFGTHFAGVFHPLHALAAGAYAPLRLYAELLQKCGEESEAALSEVVEALTLRPARLFGLRNRGELREGFFADIVIFKSDITHTIVNGVVAYDAANPMRGAALHGTGRPLSL